jgi:hypothetical protein
VTASRKFRGSAALGVFAVMGAALTVTGAAPASAQTAAPAASSGVAPATSIEQAAAARLSAAAGHSANGPAVAMHPDTTVSLAGDSKLNCLGVAGGAEAKFNDGVISYGANSGQVYGDSWGYWHGKTPKNASTLTLTDTYTITGIGTSWNGLGSGFKSLSSGTMSYTVSRNNVSSFHHGEYEVTWGGFSAWFSQTTSVDLQFPGTSCTPSASGTKYM